MVSDCNVSKLLIRVKEKISWTLYCWSLSDRLKPLCWIGIHRWMTEYIGQPGQWPEYKECYRCYKRIHLDGAHPSKTNFKGLFLRIK